MFREKLRFENYLSVSKFFEEPLPLVRFRTLFLYPFPPSERMYFLNGPYTELVSSAKVAEGESTPTGNTPTLLPFLPMTPMLPVSP